MELINGEIMHARHPDTFDIPERHARENLTPGDFAKIGLTDSKEGERFWCCIAERLPGNQYRGTVANDLCFFDLHHGASIAFGPEHILDIDTAPPAAT